MPRITVFILILMTILCFLSCGEDPEERGIEGRVIGENGKPISGASVRVSGTESQSRATDSDGRFNFYGLAAGAYQIAVGKVGYEPYADTVTVRADIASAEVVLEKEGSQTISGVVLDVETDKPVAKAQLTTNPLTYSITSDDTGSYRFGQKLTPGTYTVIATTDGYDVAEVTVVVQRGEPARADIPMKPLKPVLRVTPERLDFGGSSISKLLTIENAGTGTLTWEMNAPTEGWVEISRRQGNATVDTPNTVDVTVTRENLPPQLHQLQLTVTSNGGTKNILVTMDVEPNPILSVTPKELDFGGDKTSQVLKIENIGTGAVTWQIRLPNQEKWIAVEPPNGVTREIADTVEVTVNRSGLPPGKHDLTIRISIDVYFRQTEFRAGVGFWKTHFSGNVYFAGAQFCEGVWLNSMSRTNRFYRANRELGRIFKTQFILEYMSHLSMRRKVRRGLLKVDQLHRLARDVAYGKRGRISKRDFLALMKTCSCLTLILACIIYWQAKEIGRVLVEGNPESFGIDTSLLEHVSPIERENVVLYGEYFIDENWVR